MLILAPAALALPLVAADTQAKLRVEVTNDRGTPLDRAAVLVKFADGRSIKKLGKKKIRSWEMRTNQDGVAEFPSMPQGKVLVMVMAERYQTYGKEYEVNQEEQTIQVELLPPQQQYSVHQ